MIRALPPCDPETARFEAPSSEATSLAADTRGGSLAEYLILVGVVVLLAIQAFTGFGSEVARTMKDQMLDQAKMGL
jgi:hypothetical protein